MIRLFSSYGSTSKGVVFPPLILFFLIFLSFSFSAMGIPSKPIQTEYNSQNPFPEKIFLNIDNGIITLIARNSPLGPLMDEIGRKSGKKINISTVLKKIKITVEWNGLPFEEGIKKIAKDLDLVFKKDEHGNFYLCEEHAQIKTGIALSADKSDISSGFSQMSDQKDVSNNLINEMVIRFKQGVPEEDIRNFLSGANIKVKKYIAALNYHILTLPEGMTYYDAIVLLKSNQMLYQTDSNYLIPIK